MARIDTAGTYRMKPFDWSIKDGQDGRTEINVIFEDENQKQITWFGSLGKSENADQFALKTLITCGLSTTEISDLALGRGGGALDFDKNVEVVVEDYTKQNGQPGLRVKWINEVGGQKFEGAMTKDQAKANPKLKQYSGQLAKLQKEMGVQKRDTSPKLDF